MVMTRATSGPRFPLSCMNDLKVISGFEFDGFTSNEKDMVQVFNGFELKCSCTLITLYQGDDSEIDQYLGNFKVGKHNFFEVVCTLHSLIFFYDFLAEFFYIITLP